MLKKLKKFPKIIDKRTKRIMTLFEGFLNFKF